MFEDTMLDPAGPISAATRDLFFDSVGLMLIVVVPVFVLMALVVWRYRAGNTAAKYTPHWGGSRVVEVGLWFMPVLIVVMLWFIVWNRTHALDPYKPIASSQPPLVVQAVALDWQWLFIYPDDNIGAVNRLVFPVGRPLTIELTSDTVMNSLSIPALGGQIYAMAGMQTELNLLADRAGIFNGRNTMFNGDGFSAQVFTAEAVDAAAYQAFVAQARASGDKLDAASFETLSAPTIAGPVRLYSGVEPNLFHTIMGSHGSMPHGSMPPMADHAETFSHRDYGPRVGLFRLMGILDGLGIKATVPLSDALIARSPRVVEEVLKRGWEIVGHGEKVNVGLSSAMSEEDEKAYVEASRAALEGATGTAPRGWMGPGNTESSRTLPLLAAAGYDYTLDWGNDDQPYDFIVPSGRLSALPYSVETSDAAVIQAQSHTPWEYEQAISDHLEGLLADSNGSVMTLGLQANVSGQPFRSKYIRKFLEAATATSGVWFATGSEIIDAYRG